MKNFKLNLRWLHGSPNQTGETLTRENRLGIVTCLNPVRTLLITLLLTLGVGQMWADDAGYNGESHVYLKVNGTTKYYKVSEESWSTGATLPGTWGGVLNEQTFNSVLNIQVVGGAVGGWTNSGNSLSGTLFYKVTTNTVTPSSDWISVGAINSNSTYGSGNNAKNCFYYKNNYTTDVTPTTPGTYYLHIKITDGASNNRTSYVKLIVPSFTVAGSSAVLGSNWSATDTDNDMTFSSGTTYTLTKSNVALSTGTTYECKVVVNHSFDEAYPASNKTFTVNTTAHYNVTFSFNASSQDVEVSTTRLYSVTYNDNGKTSGSVPATSYHANGATVTVASNSGSLAKTNYSFNGWNTANNGSGTNYTAGSGTFTMGSSNKTLYAKWTQSVTLNANTSHGGSGSNRSATATWNGTALSGISHPSGATGYTCTGYFTAATDGTKVLNADGTYAGSDITGYITGGKWSRTEATTLYAQWDNHYTVTFEQGSPTFQGTGNVTATYGATLPAITVPSKTGYIFGGYYTGENGAGTRYYNENGVGLINWATAANTTLHAKWTGIDYQVAFDANEGSGTIDNQELTYGTAATALTSNTTQITRTGYYFLGWNTNADGSGTAFYNGKAVKNLTSVNDGIVTLYAQWAKTHTLYFVQADCNWNPPYAKAEISYDGQTYYPLGESNGASMSDVEGDITLSEITYNSSHIFNLFSIDGVPEGSLIKFSNNGSSPTSNMSWSTDKPYFIYGNRTWYGLDAESPRTISQATNMYVHMGDGSEYGIDKHGDEEYAIVELNGSTEYKFKYFNWLSDSWSGANSNDEKPYLINQYTTTGVSNTWGLNGSNGGKDVYMYTTVAGEYKFKLTWSSSTPQTTVYYPVGVSLAIDKTQAHAGDETTVTLTATPAKTYLMTNPTYYYQMSTDGGTNWTTIATSSSNTYAYTFAARACKFRVMLQNDAGLRSKSDEQSFTAYSTKSFYVYNPYNNATNKWRWLHLYTWDSNNGNTTYNGSFPTGNATNDCGYIQGVANAVAQNCRNGNNLQYIGDNWFYITIDERANCFMLIGEATYSQHQTVTCYTNGYIEGGKYMIYTQNNQNKVVEYQAKGASDFRLKYTSTSPSVTRYSDIYNTTLDGTSVIASMWMDASATSPTLVIQQGSGNNTWSDAVTYSGTGFTNLLPTGKTDHGYVFQMDLNLSTPAVSNVTEYTGPFYVRTDGLEGGWNAYKNNPKNTMHYSASSLTETSGSPKYDYYLCKWIGTANTNVKFTVANDYNKELVASLGHDANSTDPLYNTEKVPTPTNVRFSWNSQTNTLTRAYLSGATDASGRFLMLVETTTPKGKIYETNGSVPSGNELLFEDLGNWVYQLDMRANPGAKAKVTAKYNKQEPEFIPTTTLISGTGDSKHKYRITYDFKTNILTNAWVATGSEINETIDLNTNVMIIRNGQDESGVTQIRFGDEDGDDNKIIHAKKLISVMEFKYDDMVGRMNTWNSQAYQFCMYYISFPFNVNVGDIFGIGTYGTDWKLQYYDGAERASKGFFRGDGTTTFWKDVPANGKLDNYVGYSLLLNRVKFNDRTSDIWENKGAGSSVYLYFPSTADAETIKDDDNVTIHVPEHPCGINRTFTVDDGNGGTRTLNHMNTDSHWNMMGTPLFEHNTASTIVDPAAINGETLHYFYAWNYADNTLSAKATLSNDVQTFNAMQAYMVQYAGDVTFSGAAIHQSVAARKRSETRNLNIELQVLNTNEEEINRTYVQLKDGADADFKLNEDMYMVTNSRAVNIYTYAGDYDVAANVLPLETTTVPVGVMVKTAGTYTFSMPSHFDGTVTLVDTYAQTRTNLGIEDYTVNLEEGTFNSRFLLELNIHQAPTAIDGVSDGTLKDGKAHKFLQNGVMYILQNGVMYDAQGKRVK